MWRRPSSVSCDAARERIYPLLLRTLPADERDEFLEHAADCSECRLALETVRGRLAGVVEMPAIESQPVRRRRRERLRRALLLGLYVLPAALAYALIIYHGPGIGAHLYELRFIGRLERALFLYQQDFGSFPPSDGAPLSVYLGTTEKDGPYLELARERLDPAGHFIDRWGHRWVYTSPGIHNPRLFDLRSDGRNRRDDAGEGDDISNW